VHTSFRRILTVNTEIIEDKNCCLVLLASEAGARLGRFEREIPRAAQTHYSNGYLIEETRDLFLIYLNNWTVVLYYVLRRHDVAALANRSDDFLRVFQQCLPSRRH